MPPQHFEAEIVEQEFLPHFGNGAHLVQQQPGDGGGILIREIPVELAIEIAEW